LALAHYGELLFLAALLDSMVRIYRYFGWEFLGNGQ